MAVPSFASHEKYSQSSSHWFGWLIEVSDNIS